MSKHEEIIDYYDNLAENYENTRFNNTYGRYIDKQERIILNKLLETQNNNIVLDLGCGTGRFLNKANYGVDASEKMIELAKKKFPNKKLFINDAANTEFEDEKFDVVFSFHLLMHLDKIKIIEIINEAHRILKTGGRLIFDIPSTKRRKLLNYKPMNWHGANSFSVNDIKEMCGSKWKFKKYYGILFLPIHRIPNAFRKVFFYLDVALSNSIIREYCSYLIFEIEKK